MNLVVQGPSVDKRDVDEIVRLSKASGVKKIADNAFRLKNTEKDEAVAAYCEARRRFADLKLLAMDMDSTLITIE